MGERVDAWIEKMDREWDSPNHGLYNPDAKPTLSKCLGLLDKKGKCENMTTGMYCKECLKLVDKIWWG